jgi:carboxyl-terminal processing protease
MSLNDAVEMMRGKPGTSIKLTIAREGAEKPLTLTITRDIIKVRSVRSRMLEPGFGYLRISQFQAHTADDVAREVENLKNEAADGLKGVIIDLRNNPGGILSAAVAVSDLFLDQGLIVYTEGRVKDARLRFTARPSDALENVPLIVLVNAGSASASEIVAGALQDHKRAIIMGQKTFGKGSVQTILPMANEAALKLTTARYFTPSGRSIQASGIVPDIFIDQYTVEKRDDVAEVVTEANLSRHLTNGNETDGEEEAAPAPASAQEKEEDAGELARTDYALYEALNVLKGLAILQKKGTG